MLYIILDFRYCLITRYSSIEVLIEVFLVHIEKPSCLFLKYYRLKTIKTHFIYISPSQKIKSTPKTDHNNLSTSVKIPLASRFSTDQGKLSLKILFLRIVFFFIAKFPRVVYKHLKNPRKCLKHNKQCRDS